MSVLTLTQSPANALGTGTGVSYTLEGCRIEPGTTLPNGDGDFICPDGQYTTGNLGKGWNELDLVPARVTLDSGNSSPGTFAFALVVDNKDAGHPGYDFLSVPVLNEDLSSGDCGTISVSAQTIKTPGLGGADESRYRIITVTGMGADAVCVYDAYARLALGSHLYPGASLHFNLANDQLTTAGIGSKEVSIPVKEILPQDLNKDMTASQGSDHIWNVVKSPTPATVNFADTCTGQSSYSASASITVSWTKQAATPTGPITVITHVYASNPAHRTITVSGTDAIRSGTTVLDTVPFGPVDVPANTNDFLLLTHTFTVPAGTTNLNDIATATYTDKVTGIPVPGSTTATATATVQNNGPVTNSTATITDVESITGAGLSFSVDSVSGASGAFDGGYVAGTQTTNPVSWTSAVQSDSGSVTFNKTIYSTSANVSSGTLSDTATLNGSDGFQTSANASINIDSNATASIRVSKTTNLELANAQNFTFRLFQTPDVNTGESVTVTIPALSNGPVVSSYITGLNPTATYFFKEDASAPYPAQTTSPVTFSLVRGDPSTCQATVNVANQAGPANARVRKVTIPASSGNWTFTLTGPNGLSEQVVAQAGAGYAAFTSELDVDGGIYTITETPQAGYDLTSIVGDVNGAGNRVGTNLDARTCSFTLNLSTDSGQTLSCTFTNTQRGRIIVVKQTDPAGAAQQFEFDPSYGANFFLSHGQSNDSGHLLPGSYSVAEVNVPNGWTLHSATCSDGSPVSAISLQAGETVTCTFTNRSRGHVNLVKTVSGSPPSGSQAFTFQIRSGASPTSLGTTLETKVANSANGGNVSFSTDLVPGQTYQFCEIIMPGWLSTLTGFVPGGSLPDPDNSVVCVNFTVGFGETKTFTVDNTPPPGGRALTIGFWKNHASCSRSNGNQKPIMDQVLASFANGGVFIGDLFVNTCQEAVRILNKSNVVTNVKRAKDPAFNAAAQLLAAKLNVKAGAGTCPAATAAINEAQALLAQVNFNGQTHNVLTAAQATRLNQLAATLDAYNNNKLCT